MTSLDRLTDLLRAGGLPLAGVALLAAGREVEAGWLVIARADGLRVRVDLIAPTAQQITDATNIVQSADLTTPALSAADVARLRALAAALLAATDDKVANFGRAIALAAGDGDNIIRAWITGHVADIAAATSLINLQTRVASRGGLPQVNAGAVKTAVMNRLGTTDADA